MIKCDLHMHTVFCDGKNTPEEMVLSAINKGLNAVGVCTHSHTAFDDLYCIKKHDIKVFQDEMARLKEKYKDKIKVLCGVEQDYYGTESTDGFDYVIGSLHYFKVNGRYMHIDHSPDYYENAFKDYVVFNTETLAIESDGVIREDLFPEEGEELSEKQTQNMNLS